MLHLINTMIIASNHNSRRKQKAYVLTIALAIVVASEIAISFIVAGATASETAAAITVANWMDVMPVCTIPYLFVL